MIEPVSSTESSFRPNLGTNIFCTIPRRKVELLKRPRIFRVNFQPLHDSYLEKLIQRNIIEKCEGSNLGHIIATEVRALINSLSDENKQKFARVVKAFELDKENLEKIKGVIYSGGEMRVIAETGIDMVLYALFNLLGIKPKVVSGCSAGSFLAIAQATGSLNSAKLYQTIKTNFSSWHNAPEKLEDWINKLAVRNYRIHTGKRIEDGIFRIDHLDELGVKLEVLVGEIPNRFFSLPKIYLLPQEFEDRFQRNPGSFEVKKLIRATANLPFLFYPLTDLFKTCGNCYIEDSKGKRFYMFDPGIFLKYLLPLDLQLEEIERYKEAIKNGGREKPGFYFIVGNKKINNGQIPETTFGKPTDKFSFWIYAIIIGLSDWIDSHFLGLPKDKLESIGGGRTYLEASCKANDPDTGKPVTLSLGAFDIPEKDREIMLLANIPTSDFKDLDFKSSIDQLHDNWVDMRYVYSLGKEGVSPYNLFLNDINEVLKIKPTSASQEDGSRAIVIAKSLLQDSQRAAAL